MFSVIQTRSSTILRFRKEMLSISTAMLGGGIRRVDTVINHTLSPSEYVDVSEMNGVCRRLARKHGANPDRAVVLLTSVPQRYTGWSSAGKCMMTAGLGNACPLLPAEVWDEAAGRFGYQPGTINCVYATTQPLSEEALIEAYGIAKVSVAQGVFAWSTYFLEREYVGTQTDCMTVLAPCDESPPPLRFASLGTAVGASIVRETNEALLATLALKYSELQKKEKGAHMPGG